MTPTLPLALADVVAPGTLAALVGGLVSLQAPVAWPEDEAGGVVPLAAGLPPLLDPPHAAAARATVRSDAVTATRGAVRLGVGTVGLRGYERLRDPVLPGHGGPVAGQCRCRRILSSTSHNYGLIGWR